MCSRKIGIILGSLFLTTLLAAGCSTSSPPEPGDGDSDSSTTTNTDAGGTDTEDGGTDTDTASQDTGTGSETDGTVTDTVSDTGTADTDEPVECRENTCGEHGACDDSQGHIECTCDEGYAGDYCGKCDEGYVRIDGECVQSETCEGVDCGEHGTCGVVDNRAQCFCDQGYEGTACEDCAAGYHEDNGECVYDETCGEATCSGHGDCSVAGGKVQCDCDEGYAGIRCAECAVGYHREDEVCVEDETCIGVDCGDHGHCEVNDGKAECVCDSTWTGDICDECEAGYHQVGETCVQDEECLQNSCGGHGECSIVSGLVTCDCYEGYAGSYCGKCDEGYHLENGACVVDESCVGVECSGHGTCEVVDGYAECDCDNGYRSEDCSECALGYHVEGDKCVINETCGPDTCSGHGTCSVSGGVTSCECATGYIGESCDSCDTGYHWENNSCKIDETCGSATCSGNGTCSVSGGIASCECDLGYAGDNCGTCAAGYHLETGVCVEDQTCTATSCNGHGTCSIVDGLITCDCDTGYTGDFCDACESGYHKEYGACVIDETCEGVTCNGRGICQIVGGIVDCDCDIEYDGNYCETCSPVYQDKDKDGICERRCEYSGMNCHINAYCDDSTGTAICHCYEGYQDLDGDFECYPTCEYWTDELGYSCYGAEGYEGPEPHGTCVIGEETGAPECECSKDEDGNDIYSGDYCDTCATNYQDNDEDYICALDCYGALVVDGLTCGDYGRCDDSTGTAQCDCTHENTDELCSCLDGYQDQDNNGTCEPDCSSKNCGQNAACNVVDGIATCQCDDGYQDSNGDGDCWEACDHPQGVNCANGGTCLYDEDGKAYCDCSTADPNNGGALCDGCADDGYQDIDGNTVCEPNCATAGLDCGDYGQCSITTPESYGTAVCDCEDGYMGDDCRSCDEGYQDSNGDGTCYEDCSSVDCSAFANTSCGYSNGGIAVCQCIEDYIKEAGICEPTCGAEVDGISVITCGENSSCVPQDNTAPGNCECDPGYQDNHPDDDICRISCTMFEAVDGQDCDQDVDPLSDCDDSDGIADCECVPEGYDWVDGSCQLVDCGQLDCGDFGTCSTESGTAICECETGWKGKHCDQTAGEDCSDVATFDLPPAGTSVSFSGEVWDRGTAQGELHDYMPASPNSHDSCFAWSYYSVNMGHESTRDAVYQFSVTGGAKDVVIELTELNQEVTADGWAPLLYLRSGTCDSGTEVDCIDGFLGAGTWASVPDSSTWPKIVQNGLPQGNYWLFVDSWHHNYEFTITVTVN